MLLANVQDALFVLSLSIGGIVLALTAAGFLVFQVTRRQNLAVRVLCGVTAAVVGGGGLFVGGCFILLGLIVWGCEPEGYCPLA
jgi:hypothetical protein